jgi:signal transduction histidine kinase
MDLHETVRQTMAELELAHPERTLETACEGDGRGEWDPDRIAQVVTNLVSNALRYGDPAAPVRARVNAEDGWMVLEIHNQGPPIPEELRSRLFEPLQRGQERSRSGGRNIGLGLFIVRQLVDAHGGKIDVDSGAAGTTFRVRLPRHA